MFTGSTALRWGGRESPTRLENITGKFVTDRAPRGGLIGELHSGIAVVPAGSMWARNPIPDYGSFAGAASFDPPCKDEPKECGSAARPLLPPKSYDANALCRCSGEWGPFDMEIVDHVAVPAGLEAGEWVLNFRWDTEESNQVWQSCSDITIGVISEPLAVGAAHLRAALKSDDAQMLLLLAAVGAARAAPRSEPPWAGTPHAAGAGSGCQQTLQALFAAVRCCHWPIACHLRSRSWHDYRESPRMAVAGRAGGESDRRQKALPSSRRCAARRGSRGRFPAPRAPARTSSSCGAPVAVDEGGTVFLRCHWLPLVS
jgi:hypothetical protein